MITINPFTFPPDVPSDAPGTGLQFDVFVPGTPRPKGSKDFKGRRRNGSAILVESADVRPWMDVVAWHCAQTGVRFTGAVTVGLEFRVRRPENPTYPDAPAGPPDLDKLARAVLDALESAGTIVNDARVVDFHLLRKRYAAPAERPGVWITARRWTGT